MLDKKTILKYQLYENSVQDPEHDAQTILQILSQCPVKRPLILREDFCGTFWFASEWVKIHPDHIAYGLDLNPEPLQYGKYYHYDPLTDKQKQRLHISKENVLTANIKSDVTIAFNFSYFFFKTRAQLIDYFKSCHKSLHERGALVVDIFGGYETANLHRDVHKMRLGKQSYKYIWEQKKFNPITHETLFYIHFELKGGKKMPKAFEYDWRFWTMPEVRECMQEAGFRESIVFWEGYNKKGEGNGRYHRTREEENDPCWLAYIVAVK
jgi:hypothetical protein